MTASIPNVRLKRAGFTLVELLVVIGIIALLISILLPTLAGARRSANNVKCLSNLRQLGTGIALFTQEHDGFILKGWHNDYPRPEAKRAFDTGDRSVDWGYRPDLWGFDYVLKSEATDGSNDVFLCPSDTSGFTRGQWNDGYTTWPANHLGERAQPENNLVDNIPASYRYNASNSPFLSVAIKLTDLSNATNAMLLTDMKPDGYHHVDTKEDGGSGKIGPGINDIGNAAPFRHTAAGQTVRGSGATAEPIFKLNAVFADGHGESLTWAQTFEPIGGPVSFRMDNPRTGTRVVGVPTRWHQLFQDGTRTDKYDNPHTDADNSNPR